VDKHLRIERPVLYTVITDKCGSEYPRRGMGRIQTDTLALTLGCYLKRINAVNFSGLVRNAGCIYGVFCLQFNHK
jgi:hypothetical protein